MAINGPWLADSNGRKTCAISPEVMQNIAVNADVLQRLALRCSDIVTSALNPLLVDTRLCANVSDVMH